MAWDVSNRNCVLRSSENCPGTDELQKHLKQSSLEHDFDEFDNVYFKNGFIERRVSQLWI